ncbi:alpha/beta hydrolase [Tsukamurella serpentis]
MPSTELRTYFGPEDRPVYGALHLPSEGTARGAVLLVPPLAKKQYDAQRGLRRLADLLTARGLAVLRFDYYGTGDSSVPSGLPGAVADWIESVRHAHDYLAALGAGDPAVVAVRAGALLAAAAELTPPALVLWDPVLRGSAFVRSQQALARVAGLERPHTDPGPRAWVGLDIDREAIIALSRLRAGTLSARRMLVAAPPDAPDGFPAAERIEITGMTDFLQPRSHLVRIPDDAITAIAAWLGDAVPRREPVAPVPVVRTEARIGAVRERIEEIDGARAIRTLPAHGTETGDQQPAVRSVLLCATANDSRHGPNRAWVELARKVAAAGGSALRFDRRGSGESGPVAAGEVVPLFPDTGVPDAVAAARTCSGPLLTAGICSGAWYAAHAAHHVGADSAVLVNTVLYSWRLKQRLVTAADLGIPRTDPAFTSSARGRAKDLARRRLPYPAWRRLGRRGITQVPEVLLRPLLEAGADTTVILAPEDANWFDAQRGPEGLLRMLREHPRGAFRTVRIQSGDHSGYDPVVRATISSAILKWCTPT